jgi:hypothetical protein
MEGTIFQTISDLITQWLPVVTSVVGSFALIATMTPNKTDDKIVQFLLDIINFLGGNVGKAKNSEEV